ncbi:MAG TPA: ATP-binding protein, partial [Alphaproteobacteria bacterium]|nr:ATP-binding protein [Alphaproteobacteria bacterium]
DVLPRDLFRRSLLMIALPIMLLFGIATWFFFDRHWDTVQRRLTDRAASDIAFFVHRYQADDLSAAIALDWERATRVRCTPVSKPPSLDPSLPWVAPSFRALEHSLTLVLPKAEQRAVGQFGDDVHVTLTLEGQTLGCRVPLKRISTSTPYVFLIWIFGTAVLVVGLATYFLWRQIVPIRRLVAAMEAFGKGEDLGPIRERGADEVRRAARSFERMKARIQRQVQRRTEMLAAISHDLRTPLSRMRLEAEMLDAHANRDGLRKDIEEMESMIQGYLDFARDQVTEPTTNVDLVALLTDLATTFRHERVEVESTEETLMIRGRADALRRAFGNLAANALRYAERCLIRIEESAMTVTVTVDDDGPGIPPQQRADVFRPFVRIDQSRNKATGGAGLGLTIARDVALGHGGTLEIADSPLGGARLIFTLPR